MIIDLHTTNGSYHGYALTLLAVVEPERRPAHHLFHAGKAAARCFKDSSGETQVRDLLLWKLLGQQNPARELDPNKSADPKAWATFDYRPRFGNNYIGLRNRIAILSEAYSYIDFRKRVDVTDKFVRAILQYVADNAEKGY